MYISLLLQNCSHKQISAPQSCIFFLHLHFYHALYSPYRQTKLPMYMLINNNNATSFIPLWTNKYSPHTVTYIFTSENILSFSSSSTTVSLSFLKTNNVSGYLLTPLSWRHYAVTISPREI